jgi:hypothetical protein
MHAGCVDYSDGGKSRSNYVAVAAPRLLQVALADYMAAAVVDIQ